jgi:hypothetical protein
VSVPLLALALALTLPAPARALALDPAGASSPAGEASPEPAGASTSAREPSPEPAPATSLARPGPEPAIATTTEGGTWLDVGHAFIEHRIFAPALRVDRFFSDERVLEAERARSFIQWRQEIRFTQFAKTPHYTTTISASLKLPGLNLQLQRLSLEVSGQTRDAFTALIAPGDRTTSADTTAEALFGTTDAGVGYRMFETLASAVATHGDLGAGLILTIPPGVYGRARLRFVEALGAQVLARQALTGFWRTDTLFGSTWSAELQRPVAWGTLVRLSGTTTITERSRGFEWSGDLSLIGTVALRIGAQLGFGLSGATRAPVDVDAYRVYLRLRRDVYRRWIFVELAPEYDFPWVPGIGRRDLWSIALRLEVQFQGNEAPRAPLPPGYHAPHEPHEPAEPVDPPEARPAR